MSPQISQQTITPAAPPRPIRGSSGSASTTVTLRRFSSPAFCWLDTYRSASWKVTRRPCWRSLSASRLNWRWGAFSITNGCIRRARTSPASASAFWFVRRRTGRTPYAARFRSCRNTCCGSKGATSGIHRTLEFRRCSSWFPRRLRV